MRSRELFLRIGVAGLALAITTVAPAIAGDDSNDGNVPAVHGVVSDVSGTTVKLLAGLVSVDASAATIVAEQNNTLLTLADVKVGVEVQVEGTTVGQLIHATLIQVRGPKHDGTIVGPIGSVTATGDHFSLLGLDIAVTPTTVFAGDNGVPGSPADLVVGKVVDVEVAVFQGNLVATRIAFDGGDAQSESNN